MTEKPTEKSKQDARGKPTEKEFEHAVNLVNDAIAAEEQRLQKIASSEEQSPIMLEGYTTTNHFCQLMVDPKDVAKILLEYNYPIWHVLEKDVPDESPDEMWEALGRLYGLSTVCAVDI